MTNTARGPSRRRFSPAMLAALLILFIAGLAGVNLWYLVRLYEQTSRSTATLSVLQYGTLLTRQLARESCLHGDQIDAAAAEQLNRATDLLRHIEPGLAYVAVMEKDVAIYHQDTSAAPEAGPEGPFGAERTGVIPKRILVGTNVVPVIVFTRKLKVADGRERHLQVALKKEVVEREQAGPSTAIAAMFNLSLVTLGVAFGICLLAVIWLVRRELKWEQRRRQDEHLAFAGAVASSIIHDFRNPMSAMRLDADLLRQEAGRVAAARPERMNELAERINATLGRLELLLLEFLLVAKPEVVEQERFDVNACLRDNLDLLKLEFEKAGLRMDANLADQPLFIRGFPVQFKRALLNILKNAQHFSPKGGAVTVRSRREAAAAVVEITDEGPGVPARDRRRIFDLFYSTRPGGTGIGLALTKTAVENCGGTVRVQPGPNGKGSCFVIRVPLA
jgi:signal transduction histidine kinase